MTQMDDHNISILVVDDDTGQCEMVHQYLGQMGFSVTCAHTGTEGLKQARTDKFRLVILDVRLPEIDGFEILRRLRKHSDTPVIMLTSLGDEQNRIVGLEIGADDYLPKPFSMRELLARVRAVLRRSDATRQARQTSNEETLHFRELTVELSSRTATVNDQPLQLTPIEFDLLVCLIKAQGRVLTRDHLLNEVASRNHEVFDRVIDVHISSLRKKLNDNPRTPRFIKTVRSAGYMFLRDE